MALRISGKNFDIGESLRQHVQDRIGTSVAKFFDGSFTGHVMIDHEGTGYRSDFTLHLNSGMTLHSEGRAHEPYVSFEQSAERLEKRLRRYKQRLKGHHAPATAAHLAADGFIADYVLETSDLEADDAGTEEINPLIIAERTSALKEMSVSAAVAELDLTGARVIVFRHAGTTRVNLVYCRSDGNVGWIDPTESRGKEAAI